MLREDWKTRFAPAALGRGLELYTAGKAGEPELGEGGWSCTVDGQRAFIDDALDHTSCTCGNAPLCAHAAAACFEIEHQLGQAALAGFAPAESPAAGVETRNTQGAVDSTSPADSASAPAAGIAEGVPSPEAVLASLTDEECRAFLARIVAEDNRWAGILVRRYAPAEENALERDFMRGVRRVLGDYAHGGFIDWRASLPCANELGRYVDDYLQPLADRGSYGSVLALVNAFALNLVSVAVDDSNGFMSDMMGLCTGWWQQVFDRAPDLRPAEFAWMKSLVQGELATDEDEAGILWLIADNAEAFIERNFAEDARFARDVEAIADKIIADEQAKQDDDAKNSAGASQDDAESDARPSSRYCRWARVRLNCMRELGCGANEVEGFALSLAPSLDILQPLVDAAAKAGDSAHAIELLHRAERGGKTTDSALQLARLLDAQGRADEARDEYFYLCTKGRSAGEKQLGAWFAQLKRHAGEDWPAWERKLESALAADKGRLRDFWKWEDRADDIVRSLEGASRWECEPYRELLLERSPQTYLSAAVRQVRDELFGPATSRSDYRRGINALAQLRKIPGGEAAIAAIVDELRDAYPNRRALMEELDAVFGKRELEGGSGPQRPAETGDQA